MANSGGSSGGGDGCPTIILGLLGAGLIAVAAMEVLKLLGKEEFRYRCPNCNAAIKLNQDTCQSCNVKLSWKQDERQNA